ncbi:hypothetical protein AAKU55_005067 [Oxalobacteraceae bacterium GrIS 1.11]
MMAPIKPMAIMDAFSDGCDRANEWLDRDDKPLSPPFATHAAWRTHCYADTVRKYENKAESLQLVAEWERGFDATLRGAEEYYSGAAKSAQARAEMIRRLVERVNAVAALLSVAGVLQELDQQSALVSCSRVADGIAADLAALIGGAA